MPLSASAAIPKIDWQQMRGRPRAGEAKRRGHHTYTALWTDSWLLKMFEGYNFLQPEESHPFTHPAPPPTHRGLSWAVSPPRLRPRSPTPPAGPGVPHAPLASPRPRAPRPGDASHLDVVVLAVIGHSLQIRVTVEEGPAAPRDFLLQQHLQLRHLHILLLLMQTAEVAAAAAPGKPNAGRGGAATPAATREERETPLRALQGRGQQERGRGASRRTPRTVTAATAGRGRARALVSLRPRAPEKDSHPRPPSPPLPHFRRLLATTGVGMRAGVGRAVNPSDPTGCVARAVPRRPLFV